MAVSINRVHTVSYELFSTILALFDDIVETGTPKSAINGYVDLANHCWVEITIDGNLVGFIQFKPYNYSLVEIHPFILKQHRRYSEKAVRSAIEYIYNATEYESIITNIPSSKRYATLFARRMGFKQVGSYIRGFNKTDNMLLFQHTRFT